MDAPLWSEGASPWAHEREALAFVKAMLPNHEPYRAWTNVEFIAEDGSVNEVDLLVITPAGFFVVEIKSFPGKVFGDGQRWRHVWPDGKERTVDHPLPLANMKAKRLRSLLQRQKPFRSAGRPEDVPYVTALVFLSSVGLDCRLYDVGRIGVTGRDPDPTAPAQLATAFAPLPGIVAVIKDPSILNQRGRAINRPTSMKIAEAIELAGIKPANRGRKAGDWELGELLDEGPGWQDFLGTRPKLGAERRVRIYLAGNATTKEDEDRLRREADHEFKLLAQLRHEGIAHAMDLAQADRGPALLFERRPDEQRLDLWVPDHLQAVPLDQRIDLVRQLGEALAHAHARRVTHRSLTARSVLVCPSSADPGGLPQLVIGHWQTGARDLATRLTSHGDTAPTMLGGDLLDRLAGDEQVYLAPETFSVEDPDPTALDVFSLGALAYLLFAGTAPAADLAARDATLAEHHGLSLAAAVDGLPDDLATFVQVATDPVPAQRAPVRELLDLLDDALAALTAPSRTDPGELRPTVDPIGAHQGDVLDGGWVVERRLGSGSTAIALLCSRAGSNDLEVLKVAKDEELGARIRDEARTLDGLNAAGIVRLLGLEHIAGRTTLRLTPAGDPNDKAGLTLADRLQAQGRVGLDLLERFGIDLLDTLGYLESMGVAHRDIKPDNLGVRPRPGDRSLHLVLFDFSLARTPDTSIAAGTTGYLDPFLAERPNRRWDPAADRYAAAATIFEMTTGQRPVWGDGRTDPMHLADLQPRLDPELFDSSVRDAMTRFFAKALHRRPGDRYHTAGDMLDAWRAMFAVAARPVTTVDDEASAAEALDGLAAAANADTPVIELGLSGLALSVLERRGIGTVGQLLEFPPMEWNRTAGLGLRVRREILDAVARLREHVDVEPTADDASISVDRLVASLVPRPTTPQAQADQQPLAHLLGLPTQPELGREVVVGLAWPTTADLRAALDLDRAEVDAVVERARGRWVKQPAVTQVRHDIAKLIERAGGVLSADDIGEWLLAQRGSTATGALRAARGRAVVRAALEAESSRGGNRFTWRRVAGGASAVVAMRTVDVEGEELVDYATNVGAVADQLAASDPLPAPAAALVRLRAVAQPVGFAPLPDVRLARLAAAASATAAVSSRLELYPRQLSPERAVRLARAALLGAGTLTEDEVRSRVATRLPAAAALPQRPQLDELLQSSIGLEWHGGGTGPTGAPAPPGYRVPSIAAPAMSTAFGASGLRYRTGTLSSAPDDDRAVADAADERLARSAARGGYLVLTANPRHARRAAEQLAAYGPDVIDVDSRLVGSMRSVATTRRVEWPAIVAADAAGPSGNRWANLGRVVRDALAPLRTELLDQHEHVLLVNPGLLGRYDELAVLDELRERTRQPAPGQRLRTLWVLVTTDDPAAGPTVAGRAVPITTAAERMELPAPWLENLHRTRTTPVGGPS